MTTPQAPDAPNGPRFIVKGQYIRDLSFENPHAPHSLTAINDKPKLDVSIDLSAQRMQEGFFELTLHLTARAMSDNNTLFLVDLVYGGIFQIINIPEDRVEQTIMVDGAFVLFPFARRVIADVTRDGGFPPLMLEPIDFVGLYIQKKQQQTASNQSA
jgi:preprotein translocase subunit SecB